MRTEAYSGPRQTFKLELFAKIVNGWELLTIFAKSFILSIWRSFDYAYREIFSIVPKVVDQPLLIDMQIHTPKYVIKIFLISFITFRLLMLWQLWLIEICKSFKVYRPFLAPAIVLLKWQGLLRRGFCAALSLAMFLVHFWSCFMSYISNSRVC